jgi:hypothetical protein
MSIASQARGCGTPPPLVILQSKLKFIEVVTENSPPISETKRGLIAWAIDKIIELIPDAALTGLQTRASVRATASACFELNREEGGTAQQINNLCWRRSIGQNVPVRDLWTGEIQSWECSQLEIGEYIFYACLEEVLSMDPEKLRELKLLVVRDPGKGRAITKGHACLKIVLDVVNKLCAKVLAKSFESSHSGMEKSNHMWGLFQSFFTNEMKDVIFHPEKVEKNDMGNGETLVTTLFSMVYALSTDYDDATNFFDLTIGKKISVAMMRKCGIPSLLIGIVIATSFTKRRVLYSSYGIMKHVGEKYDEDQNSIHLSKGLMMGDPLTKVILHLLNIGVRMLADGIVSREAFDQRFTNSNEIKEFVKDYLGAA